MIHGHGCRSAPPRPPQLRKIDGDKSSDEVSPEAFALLCPTHGITPNYPAGSGTVPGGAGFGNVNASPGRHGSRRMRADTGAGE